MNISNLRPDTTQALIEMALRELRIVQEINEVQQLEPREANEATEEANFETADVLRPWRRRSVDERALMPRVSSLENSFVEHINSSIPSLDEIVIRSRGRRKQPAKISWSPIKSPFKTPTKRNSTLHMSLLSPSPAKKLFGNNNNGSPMILRNSPRKRILTDTPNDQEQLNGSTSSSSSLVCSTPTKRLKFSEDLSMNASTKSIPLKTLLKPMSQSQLVDIICELASKNPEIEQKILTNLPVPEIRPFEQELCTLRKSVSVSSPRSRLLGQSKTDGAAYSRASSHLTSFKKAIANNCKLLQDSHAFDALLDYVLLAWTYVRGLPSYDEPQHNFIRKDCFKMLSLSARLALRQGGSKLGADRIGNFRNRFKSMANDFEEIEKCRELLFSLNN